MGGVDVAIVSPYPSADQGDVLPSGVAWYTARLADALAGKGMQVSVLAPMVEGEPEVSHVGGVTVERRYRSGAAALPKAVGAAHRTAAPVVHLQHEVFLFGGPSSIPGLVPALATARRRRRGPIVTMHQVVDPSHIDHDFTRVHRVRVPPAMARIGMATVQRSVRTLAAATVVHERSFGEILRDAVVVPVGVDRRGRIRTDQAKKMLGLGSDRLVVMCFGFLAPYKGLEAALDAARIAGNAVELVVAGGEHPRLAGKDCYGESLRRRYESSARFTGYVPAGDVATWFSAADVVLLPYPRPFASSGPLAQALGFGTPVLCSPALAACVGAPDEVVAPIDPVGLSQRLVELASNPVRLDALRRAGVAMAADRTWDRVAQRHVSLYEEVIDADRAPGGRLRTVQPG
jgi:glycosyltransferase involved in cell wall biosynthesis